VLASLFIFPADKSLLTLLREKKYSVQYGFCAITLLDDLCLVRYLGHRTDEANRLFQKIWHSVRPLILNKKACSPRIWAT
jgi:urease accessory protein